MTSNVEEGKFDKQRQYELTSFGRLERRLEAMSARWGISSEAIFHLALVNALEKLFNVETLSIDEFDTGGFVFGLPEQIELDVIIQNGLLILCELKSSMSKADMHTFKRKTEFYQQKHNRQADRLLVISPMIDGQAQRVGKQLGIEMFSDVLDVDSL